MRRFSLRATILALALLLPVTAWAPPPGAVVVREGANIGPANIKYGLIIGALTAANAPFRVGTNGIIYMENGASLFDSGGTAGYANSGGNWTSFAAGTGDFKADGSVPMTGNLNMGAQALTNVGNVDGVDVSAHATSTSVHHTATVDTDTTYNAGTNMGLVGTQFSLSITEALQMDGNDLAEAGTYGGNAYMGTYYGNDTVLKGPFEDVRAYVSFASAITSIGATQTTLLIPNSQTVSADVTVPSTMELMFTRNGSLSIDTGMTVTINGPLDAPLSQIFSGSGNVSFGAFIEGPAYPQWWGAFPTSGGDLGADYTAQIDKVITALRFGQDIYLTAGNWYMNIGVTSAVDKRFGIIGAGSKLTRLYNPKSDGTASISFDWTGFSTLNYARKVYFIRDLEIDGHANSGAGIYIKNAANIQLENLSIKNHATNGIHLNATLYITIKNVNLAGNPFVGDVVSGVGYNQSSIDGMEITGNRAGFYLNRATNIKIDRLTIQGIDNSGTTQVDTFKLVGVTNATIKGLWFEDITPKAAANQLINLDGVDNIEFKNLTTSVTGFASTVYMNDATGPSGNVTFKDSLIIDGTVFHNASTTGSFIFDSVSFREFKGVIGGPYEMYSPSMPTLAGTKDWIVTRHPSYQPINKPSRSSGLIQTNIVTADSNFDDATHLVVDSGTATVPKATGFTSKASESISASDGAAVSFTAAYLSTASQVSSEYVMATFMVRVSGGAPVVWGFNFNFGGSARHKQTVTLEDGEWQQIFMTTASAVSGTVNITITAPSAGGTLSIDNMKVVTFSKYHPGLIDDFSYSSVDLPEVDSEAALQLWANEFDMDVLYVTGTTDITSVNSTFTYNGREVTLLFAGALTFTDGSNLKLNGNFSTSANDTITLWSDGTNWYEISRSNAYVPGGTDVAVPDGGTGKSSWTQYAIPYLDTTTSFGEIAAPANSTQYLQANADGTGYRWTTPSGSGDMTKATYDTDADNDIDLAAGGTNASLADPNEHAIFGWDDTSNATTLMSIGSGLAYDATTDTLSSSGGSAPLAGTNISVSGQTVSMVANLDGAYINESTMDAALLGGTIGSGQVSADFFLESEASAHAGSASVHHSATVDTDTTYNAGNGISLAGTTFSADNAVLYFDSEATAHAGSASVHHTATVDTDTTYNAGAGIALTGTTFSFDGTLDEVGNPATDKTFTMGNNTLTYSYAGPSVGAFVIDADGGFTGDLLHVHQHTGNPSTGTYLFHLENDDVDVVPMMITTVSSKAMSIGGGIVSSSGASSFTTLTLGNALPAGSGGTGANTLTDGGVLLGSGTGAVTPMAVLADSAMIVGDGTTDPVAESGNTLRTSIGVGTGDTPQFTGIEVGAATDTTLTRLSAGVLAAEGVTIALTTDLTAGADDWVTSGTVNGLVNVTSTTAATLVLTAAQCASDLHVNGDNDVIDYTLPTAVAGQNCGFYTPFDAIMTVDTANTGDSIILGGTTLTAGNAVDSAASAGSYAYFMAISASQWSIIGEIKTWVDGGAD